jgi:hypothetical protein
MVLLDLRATGISSNRKISLALRAAEAVDFLLRLESDTNGQRLHRAGFVD